jgi:hypothetical protein
MIKAISKNIIILCKNKTCFFITKKLLLFFAGCLLVFSKVFADQSTLPPCPDEYKISGFSIFQGPDERWHNCFGRATDPKKQTYIGEWKNGLPDGQGLLDLNDGIFLLGVFKRQQISGAFIRFQLDGKILFKGIVNGGKVISDSRVHYEQFDDRLTKTLTKNDWEDYFLKLNVDGKQDLEKCFRNGLASLKLMSIEDDVPGIKRSSPLVRETERICMSFLSKNVDNIKNVLAGRKECIVRNFPSVCQTQVISRDGAGQVVVLEPEKVYSFPFLVPAGEFITVETDDGKKLREIAEEKKRIDDLRKSDELAKAREAAEETKRVDDLRRSDELAQAREASDERKRAAEQRRLSEQVVGDKKSTKNEPIKKTNTYSGNVLFGCSVPFSQESFAQSIVRTATSMLNNDSFNQSFLSYLEKANGRLQRYGDLYGCTHYGWGFDFLSPVKPDGQRSFVRRGAEFDFVSYRTSGTGGVGISLYREKR